MKKLIYISIILLIVLSSCHKKAELEQVHYGLALATKEMSKCNLYQKDILEKTMMLYPDIVKPYYQKSERLDELRDSILLLCSLEKNRIEKKDAFLNFDSIDFVSNKILHKHLRNEKKIFDYLKKYRNYLLTIIEELNRNNELFEKIDSTLDIECFDNLTLTYFDINLIRNNLLCSEFFYYEHILSIIDEQTSFTFIPNFSIISYSNEIDRNSVFQADLFFCILDTSTLKSGYVEKDGEMIKLKSEGGVFRYKESNISKIGEHQRKGFILTDCCNRTYDTIYYTFNFIVRE